MKKILVLTFSSALALSATGGYIQAQGTSGCVTTNDRTSCNWSAFENTLNTAHLLRLEYKAGDGSSLQLKEMAKSLGKTVAQKGERADLTVTVVPAVITGVDIGPADKEILELRFYSGGDGKPRLVWVETYIGQKDKPWPANVHEAIQQFLKRLPQNKH